MVLDDAEYDDDCLGSDLVRAALYPCQCFAWAVDVTSDSVRCLACPVATEPAVDWALEVERFAVDQAERLSPERSRCETCATSVFRHFLSASLDHAEDAVAEEQHACEEPAVVHESQPLQLVATQPVVA